MSQVPPKQLLEEARAAWRAYSSAVATIQRLRGYKRLNAAMKEDLNAACERERDAYHTLNRVLSPAASETTTTPQAAASKKGHIR